MPQRTAAEPAVLLQRTSKLIGKKVHSMQKEEVGSIYDLVLTLDYQQISYAALSHGQMWGVSAKLFAIPWMVVRMGPQGEIMVPISQEQLKEASGFDRDNWPAQGDRRWLGAMEQGRLSERESTMARQREFEGEEHGPMATMRNIQKRRVTNLTGTTVKNGQGEDIGNVEDFVVDMREGRLAYTIVSFGGFWGIGEKCAAVPSSAVEWPPRANVARLDADRKTLEAVAFEPGRFPNLADRNYARRIHETFDAEPYWMVYGYVRPEERRAAMEKIWGAEGMYARHFDRKKTATMRGTVQSIGTFQPEADAPDVSRGLRLRVMTNEGKFITVFAGPRFYAQRQNFHVMPGDEISVTGSMAKVGWRSVFIASEIKKGAQTLQLLNKAGQPQWRWQQEGAGR